MSIFFLIWIISWTIKKHLLSRKCPLSISSRLCKTQFRNNRGSFAILRVRGGWEAARFPAGMAESLLELKLCGVSPANPFPRESPSFPTTPFVECEKRTPFPSWIVFTTPLFRSINRSVSSSHEPEHGSLILHSHQAG